MQMYCIDALHISAQLLRLDAYLKGMCSRAVCGEEYVEINFKSLNTVAKKTINEMHICFLHPLEMAQYHFFFTHTDNDIEILRPIPILIQYFVLFCIKICYF